jgi:hypothetical protein
MLEIVTIRYANGDKDVYVAATSNWDYITGVLGITEVSCKNELRMYIPLVEIRLGHRDSFNIEKRTK